MSPYNLDTGDILIPNATAEANIPVARRFFHVPELRLRIFQYLRTADLASAALVNHAARNEAIKTLYRTMTFGNILEKDRQTVDWDVSARSYVRYVIFDFLPFWPHMVDGDTALKTEYGDDFWFGRPFAPLRYNPKAVETLIAHFLSVFPNVHRFIYDLNMINGPRGTRGADCWAAEIRDGKPVKIYVDSQQRWIHPTPVNFLKCSKPTGPFGAVVIHSYEVIVREGLYDRINFGDAALDEVTWTKILSEPEDLPPGLSTLDLEGILLSSEHLIRILQYQKNSSKGHPSIKQLKTEIVDPLDLSSFRRIVEAAGPALTLLELTRLGQPISFNANDIDPLETLLRERLPALRNLRISLKHNKSAEKCCLGVLTDRMAKRTGTLTCSKSSFRQASIRNVRSA